MVKGNIMRFFGLTLRKALKGSSTSHVQGSYTEARDGSMYVSTQRINFDMYLHTVHR